MQHGGLTEYRIVFFGILAYIRDGGVVGHYRAVSIGDSFLSVSRSNIKPTVDIFFTAQLFCKGLGPRRRYLPATLPNSPLFSKAAPLG